ncbi:MAG: class I SAM-dependent methyltransferase [Clostridia bacterium]|nr:class I SAM-dependent methyltransferase [Clostridia bacterium]
MYCANDWVEYEVIDTGDGEKLERWKDHILRRPDPQAIWPKQRPELWEEADAIYHRSVKGGGSWEFRKKLPEQWIVEYQGLKFYVHPTGFKHTGLFPEQAVNWQWMRQLISGSESPVRVLNLFGYTGGATCACASAGAKVTHVDAAKGMVQWAGENRKLCGIDETRVRWIVDDAVKFVQREARRGNTYEGILMDPPSYGRGPGGEVWKLENELFHLVQACEKVLSDNALFMLINSYTTGLQPAVLSNILALAVQKKRGGTVAADEIVLPVSSGGVLPCGASGRWSRISHKGTVS